MASWRARSVCSVRGGRGAARPALCRTRDDAGLAADCRIARRDGFTGRIAVHPDQAPTINPCFSPSPDDLAHARRVVAAFAAAPDAGTIGIEGKMYDIHHLKSARRTLAAAGGEDR